MTATSTSNAPSEALPDRSGWIGTMRQLTYALRQFGAECDETGRVLITGQPPATFLGLTGPDAEVIVPADCMCRINGHPASVVGLLRSTSYGLGITVIM